MPPLATEGNSMIANKLIDRDAVLKTFPLADHLQFLGIKLKGGSDRQKTANRCPQQQHREDHFCVTVDLERQIWHCNDCDIGGSVIDWLAKEQNKTPANVFKELGAKLDYRNTGTNGQWRKPERRIVKRYSYRDEQGAELFQCVRYEPKDFSQGHKGPDAKWIDNIQGVRRVLYRLPELLEGLSRSLPVLIVEGEKDVETLVARGYLATTNPMGAKKWQPEYSETLKGAQVYILPDNDKTGREHAEQVAASLHGKVSRVATVTIPQVPNGLGVEVKDVSDFFSAGGTKEQLQDAIDTAQEWKPGELADDDSPAWADLIEDAAQIVVKELPPLVEIIEGLITRQSKCVIGSSAKSFKTWVTIDAALSIAHGAPFLGRQTRQCAVLYVNLELKRETFDRRVQIVAKAKGLKTTEGAFLHLPLRGKLSGLTIEEIISRIIKLAIHHKAAVVVLDPIYKLNLVGDENSSRDQTILFNELDRITTEGQCTLIFNDHFGKGNQSEKDPLDAIRGSSAKGGDVDAAIILRKHEVQDCYRVDVVHRELPPVQPFCIGWNFPLMEIRTDLDPESMKKAKAGRTPSHDPKKLLAFIRNTTAEKPISISGWADAAGMNRQTLSDYLPEMRRKGWITTVGEGNTARQHITEKGRKEVDS